MVEARAEQVLSFDPRHYRPVAEGRKRATTRIDEPVELGPIWLVFEFDEPRQLAATIDEIVTKRWDDLSDDDAREEGLASADGLRDLLLEYYPTAIGDSDVEFIRFSLTPVTER
ncbi:MAG: ASCH domain-containing protein [Pseudolysinimonas sp.]|uniref:ASCH domain-containing protein n=1 Tax=Pseudolysinimonas sp. TaxID=2680009 RepID=UPI0032633711